MSGKSTIWNYFKRTDDQDKAACNVCEQTYSCKNGTTSSLINHLRSKHKEVHEKFLSSTSNKRNAPAIATTSQPQIKQIKIQDIIPANESAFNEAVDDAIVDFLADSGVPFRVVGLDSFKNLLTVVNRRVKLKHQQTYSRKIKTKGENIKSDIYSIIDATKEDIDCFGFTTDIWTSRSGHPYISLTIHFIEKDWNLLRFTPFVAPFPADHTGKNIALGLDSMIESLGLDNGNWDLYAVNDNAANMKLGIRLSMHLKQYLCDIHTLELAVKDTFKNVHGMNMVTKKCKAIGKFTHHSTVANEALKKEAKKVNIKFKKVVNPPSTRWSGHCDNLESVLHLKKAIMNLTANNDAWAEHELYVSEWKLIEGSVNILRSVRSTVKAWESEKEPTMHRVVERLYTMNTVIDDFCKNSANNRYGIGFAKELKKQISIRFPDMGTENKLRRFANYLSPHYKGIHLETLDKLDFTKNEICSEAFNPNDVVLEPRNPADDIDLSLSPTSQLRKKMLARNQRTETERLSDSSKAPIEKEFRKYE